MARKVDIAVRTKCSPGRLRPAMKNNTQPERDLRDQLRKEIENKAKACSNPTFDCNIPRVEGYDFCIRHILRDPRGFYRQCGYIYPNGRKCFNALPKYDLKKDPSMTIYCFEHSRQAQLTKTRTAVGRLMNVDTNDVVFHNLVHHINIEEPKPRASVEEGEEVIDVESPPVAPFLPHDHVNDFSTYYKLARKHRRVLDYASDSSSNTEDAPCLFNTFRGLDNTSDMESMETINEDLLKHANIYTRQEAISISEAKLTKLQGLYIEQINILRYVLKERRRRYLQALRKEREYLCSIHSQPKESMRERILYGKLKALSEYHRRRGMASILYKKFKDKRTRAADGGNYRAPNVGKCIYTEGGVRCCERVVPSMKYCRKHTLQDKKQAMFQACGVESSSVVCQEPVPIIYEELTCTLHLAIPNRWHYVQKKYDSESDDDGPAEVYNFSPPARRPETPPNLMSQTSPAARAVVIIPNNGSLIAKQEMLSPTTNCNSDKNENITIAHDIKAEIDVAETDVANTVVVKTDVAETEVAETDVAKIDDAKTDVAKTDVAKTDVAKTDVAKTDVAKTDVAETDVAKTDVAVSKIEQTSPVTKNAD